MASDSKDCLICAGGIFVKAVSDTNAAALDKVLDALQAYLQKTDEKQAAR